MKDTISVLAAGPDPEELRRIECSLGREFAVTTAVRPGELLLFAERGFDVVLLDARTEEPALAYVLRAVLEGRPGPGLVVLGSGEDGKKYACALGLEPDALIRNQVDLDTLREALHSAARAGAKRRPEFTAHAPGAASTSAYTSNHEMHALLAALLGECSLLRSRFGGGNADPSLDMIEAHCIEIARLLSRLRRIGPTCEAPGESGGADADRR